IDNAATDDESATTDDQAVATRAGGAIKVHASEDAGIHATGVAASLSLSAGLVGISFALAGADINNVILTKTNADVENSVLDSGGNVTIEATDTSTIDATVDAAAGSASGGIAAGSGAVGFVAAKNLIGYDAAGNPIGADAFGKNPTGSQVRAYVADSSID